MKSKNVKPESKKSKTAKPDKGRTQRSLQQSIFEHSMDGIAIANEKGAVIEWNPAMEHITGFKKDEILGQKLCDVQFRLISEKKRTPQLRKHLKEVMRCIIKDSDTSLLGKSQEVEIQRADGSICVIETIPFSIETNSGIMIASIHRDITGRKRTEQALRESEERYRLVSETARELIVINDYDGNIVYGNKAASDLLEIDKEEINGKNISEFLSPEETKDMEKKRKKRTRGFSGTSLFERKIISKTGREYSLEINSTQFTDAKGNQRILTIGRDITERKRAEKLIRKERDLGMRLSRAVSLEEGLNIYLDYAISVSGMDCGGIYLINENDGSLNLVVHEGLSEAFVNSESHYSEDSENTRIVLKGNPIYVEYKKLGIKLDKIQLQEGLKNLSIVPIKNKDKVVACLNISSHELDDISEFTCTVLEMIAMHIGPYIMQAMHEDKTRQSQQNLNTLFNTIEDFLFILDMKGNIIHTNHIVRERLGYTREELTSMNITQVHPSDMGETVLRIISEIMEGKRNEFSIPLMTRDGANIPAETKVTIGKWDSKDAIFGLSRDITKRKRLEEQLHQTEKMEAVGQLAGGIAHDFNNQLAGIMGYADLLHDETGGNPVFNNFVDNIIKCTERAADLTSQLLAFARKGKVQTTQVDIHRIVFEVVNLLRHSIEKKINISQQLNANPCKTMGDPTQLQNAVLNLGLNARDAMPDGGELTFATDIVELDRQYCKTKPYEITPGKYLQICVTDTGCGMDKETQKHIFEPFFTTKNQGKGTGMGLAAVYGTIKSHRGSISVYSEEGHGTTFKLYLPLVYEADTLSIESDRRHTIKGKGHILLVEDENVLRNVATNILESLGYDITVCSNGKEAVGLYRKLWQSIDLVILDMIMPVMNGKEAFLAMRKINPDIKVLLASGYSINGIAQSILDKGANGFIQKPFRKGHLSKKIAEILRKRK